MMFRNLFVLVIMALLFTACSDDDDGNGVNLDPVVMDVEVGGPTEPFSVYVNLETSEQTLVARDSWDLGFYSGESGYRVVLNPGAFMMAQPTEKNDITAVGPQDTVDLINQMDQFAIFNAVLENPRPDWLQESQNWIDNSNGDLDQTAINAVSENSDQNLVNIVNRGWGVQDNPRGWMKVKVNIVDGNYQLQYAPIDSDDFQTVEIPKRNGYNFNFFNFDTGIVEVEPPKDEWQLAFSSGLALFRFAGVLVPYAFRDYVFHNRYGVEIAEILFEDEDVNILDEYNSFGAGNLADVNVQYDTDISTIGSGWRTIGNPQFGGETAVRSDRFYVVKTADDVFYKLIFVGLLSETGERGHPSILFERLTI